MDLLNPFKYKIEERIKKNSNIEIEAKKIIDQFSFQLIRILLTSLDQVKLTKYSTYTYKLNYNSSMREIVSNKNRLYEIKNRIGKLFYNGTNITISEEIPIKANQFFEKKQEINPRYFRRDIIRISSKKYNIDISKVTDHIWDRNIKSIVKKDHYEFEIEYNYNSKNWRSFLELIDKYISLIHSNRPVDLHFPNLTFENLIQNPYTLSVKADGIHRKLIIFKKDYKLFLMFANIDNTLEKIELEGDIKKIFPDNFVYVLDGEYMNKRNEFHAFDILIYENVIVSNLKFKNRYNYLVKLFKKISNLKIKSNFKLTLKEHIFVKTSKDFFKSVEKLLHTDLDNDGIIFTPGDDVYLSNYIFKWKPIEKLTIDLFYENRNLYVYDPTTRRNLPFNNTFEIDTSGLKYTNGKVIEFSIDLKNKLLTANRIRNDKIYPNKYSVVENIFKLHKNPITTDIITGKNTKLMRKYHNKVKSKIYDDLKLWGVNTILDIGSGLGGDVLKWKKNGFDVTGIEPNPNNIQELVRRLDYADFDINLFEGRFEDVEINKKFDCITSFNSFTFLTKTNEYMKNVVNKMMKHDSEYIVIVGFDVMKFFEFNNIKIGSKIAKYKTSNFDIEVDKKNNKVIIEILTGASVPKQEEYIIDFEYLKTLFKGYNTIKDEFLNKEKLMSEEQYFYSSSTRLLIFKKSKTTIKKKRLYLNIKMLEPQQQKYVGNLYGFDIYRIGSIGDNNCLIHSILDMYNSEYQKLSPNEKSKTVLQIRKYICKNFTRKVWNKYIGSLNNSFLNKEYSYEKMKNELCDMNVWLDDIFIPYLSDVFEKNIVIYQLDTNGNLKYISNYNIKPIYENDRDTIILYYYHKNGLGHYEGIGINENNSLITVVHRNTPLFEYIKKQN
jgi:hypothetical protein